MCPYVGGNWSNGANAGLWYVNCNNSASNSNSNIGARLASDLLTARNRTPTGWRAVPHPSGRLSSLHGETSIERGGLRVAAFHFARTA